MSMKSGKCLFISLLLFALASAKYVGAQTYGTGLLANDEELSTFPVLRYGIDFTDEFELKKKASLRAFCPSPGNQGRSNSCTGWAVGYSAFTLCYCANNNITNQADKDSLSFSAMFLYNQLTKGTTDSSCSTKTSILAALKLLSSAGDCRLTNFSTDNCDSLPSKKTLDLAKRFRLDRYDLIFKKEDSSRIKLGAIIRNLAQQKPVIISLKVTKSFFQRTPEIWHPTDEFDTVGHHAVVVIGYNNESRTFELQNSYGKNWRDNGFFFMTYEDFFKYCNYAFVIKGLKSI